ncbi:non-reducing end alpha-L-arabinofuranosidase family hydrolase [Streptomyces europaeiscabiei]|uniref:non-reducing end alpha-L-arabinofuranosidase family hydrolase n=1 Tax=Streptomyces europaeiscabiei TaxID=146819 RepID=UPI0038F7CB0E
MNEFVHSADPPRRPRARPILPPGEGPLLWRRGRPERTSSPPAPPCRFSTASSTASSPRTRGRRRYRSFTSGSLGGSWTPHPATEPSPCARSDNVTFSGPAWTRDFSHGELLRAGDDQTVPLNPCQSQFLYQGMHPNAGGDRISLPWRMGLLTQTNSTC